MGVIRSWIGYGCGSEGRRFTIETAVYFERFISFGCSTEVWGVSVDLIGWNCSRQQEELSNVFRKFLRFFTRNDNTLANLRKVWAEWRRCYQI